MSRSRTKPEVMSPAGYWPQLQAAIESGADAVYFGLKHFTARAKAGFDLSELPEVMRTLHRRGVRGFVTFNTLVFEHELLEAARTAAAIAEAGADAVIIQDAGVMKLVHEIAPDLEIHASTQMSITDAEGAEAARELGASRVTLARELSLKEIRAIRERTDIDLEIFVHGALCVAYSGQCFSSEAWGGRSANRGQCAQACRLPYELVVDDEVQPLGEARYLLSPGDLYALENIPEIVDIGISTLKIEGRYKDPDYVAVTTRAYREAVDAAWGRRPLTVDARQRLEIEQVYSRGLAPHFLQGTNHQTVVEGRAPRHRGVLMGRVARVLRDEVWIEPADAHNTAALKAGDGVVFDAATWKSPQDREEGGRIFGVLPKGRLLSLRFGNGAIDFSRVREGDWLWRTDDPDLARSVKPILEAKTPLFKQPVTVRATARVGEKLSLDWSVRSLSVHVESETVLEKAQSRGLEAVQLRDQLARLGNTPYELTDLESVIEGEPFVPVSLLNQLRRSAVEQLQLRQSELPHRVMASPEVVLQEARAHVPSQTTRDGQPQLHLLVRTPEQMQAAIDLRPSSITLDYLDLFGLKPSVEQVRTSGIPVRVASPRILKPGEEKIADFLLRLECPLLIRSAGLLRVLERREARELSADFSFNITNSVTADLFLRHNLSRMVPGDDLNGEQVAELAAAVDASKIEVIAYQHLPVFHTEHCVFCRFMSTGTSYLDCGRPCESHRVSLRDVSGREHPVLADTGCRNTVFGAEAQHAADFLARWRQAGIRHFRLDFAHEQREQVYMIADAFTAALDGRLSIDKLRDTLRRASPHGITQGSLFVAPNYDQLPVLQ